MLPAFGRQTSNIVRYMSTGNSQKVCIIGAVAGGASAAARLRRVDENAEIILFDKGPYVSFANCGLPYYVGNVIKKKDSLLVASADMFRDRFNIQVRTENEVLSVDRKAKKITVKRPDNSTYEESYDKLLLAPGARPIRPAQIPGISTEGIFTMKTIPDTEMVREWIDKHKAKSALIIGGGFIGLEMADNLVERGLNVTLLEKLTQVMPPFDKEMAVLMSDQMAAKGVNLVLGDGLSRFDAGENSQIIATTESGKKITADMVLMSIGVLPDSKLAADCGLELGARGAIVVDQHMQTSDPDIYAVGDAVETINYMTGQHTNLALAGPANRQGRIAAENMAGRKTMFRGVQGTSVCGAFGLTMAMTGASEKATVGKEDVRHAYLHPGHHVGYYPGAKKIHMKLTFNVKTGEILGCQAVGEEGVEKRIDVVAMAMQKHGTVEDLMEAELCYAPQYGAAKDPINLAGMIAQNAVLGDAPLCTPEAVMNPKPEQCILDVRDPYEYDAKHIPGAVNIPLNSLRDRLSEVPRTNSLYVTCAEGKRAYIGQCILRQNGISSTNVSGGMTTYNTFEKAKKSGSK